MNRRSTPSRTGARGGSRSAPPPRCLILVSEQDFFVREEIAAFQKGVFGDRDPGPSLVDFSCKPKPGEESPDPRGIVDELRTPPLFGGAKLVLVSQPEALPADDLTRLGEALRSPAAGVHAVLWMNKLRKASKVEKLLAQAGEIRRLRALYDRPGPWQRGTPEHQSELTQWLVERAAGRRLRLTPRDAFRLVRKIGNHPARLESELEKLSLLVGPDGEAGPDQIDSLSAGGGEYKAFDLADAVAERELRKAIEILGSILDEGMVGWGDRSKLVSLPGISAIVVGAIRSKLVDLLRVRARIEAGVPRREVIEEMRAPGFLKENLFRQASLHTVAGLEHRIEDLLGFDRALKGGTEFPEATLERMVVTLAR